MKSSLFPDVNVWLALTHNRHVHHALAADWFQSLSDEPIFFCRFTQLGLLRLLTNQQVMGLDVMSQRAAWRANLRWYEDQRIEFHREPESADFERLFQEFSAKPHPSTKLWADAYLAAFAKSAGLTIVTFDKTFLAMAGINAKLLSFAAGTQHGGGP
jgi:toxin-antitoxin system PIN domain toxin